MIMTMMSKKINYWRRNIDDNKDDVGDIDGDNNDYYQ